MSARRVLRRIEEDPIRQKYEAMLDPAFLEISTERRLELDSQVRLPPTAAELEREDREFNEGVERMPKARRTAFLENWHGASPDSDAPAFPKGPHNELESKYFDWRTDIEAHLAREHATRQYLQQEKPAQTGKPVLAGAAKGGKKRSDEYAPNRAAIRAEFEAYLRRNKTVQNTLSPTGMRSRLAKKYHVSSRSVLRYTSDK